MRSVRRADLSLVLILFVVSLLLRLLFLASFQFDGLYGQDAYAYYDFAQSLRSAIGGGQAPGVFFWPLGYPALLGVALTLFGAQAAPGQTLNILLGSSLAPLVYILARQIESRPLSAFVAGLLMAVCGQALQSSLVLMADIPALFWAVISAVALWQYLRNHQRRWLAIAAITLASASVTRWLYLALMAPWGLALLLSGNIRRRDILLASVPAAVILVLQLAYSSASPYPTFNHAWVEGWSPANAFRREFTNVDGHFLYEKANGLYYAQPFYDAYYLAPAFSPFLLVGLSSLLRQRRFPQAALLAGWALLPYLFLAGIPYQNIRFPLIVFPAVAILAGIGIDAAYRWLKRYQALLAGLALAGVLLWGIVHTLSTTRSIVNTFIANQQRDKAVAAWAAERIPPGAAIYTFGLTLTLKHYTSLVVYELYYETPATLAQRWQPGRDDYLLLDVYNIEHQWAGREPQTAFRWLRDTRGLTELGHYGSYTLYRVSG